MNAQLTWIATPLASLAHAASMRAQGQTLVDRDLAARLEPIIAETDFELLAANLERKSFWANVVPASAELSPLPAPHIAEKLFEQLRAMAAEATSAELLLRSGPLRELWEARGPGLWRSLCRLAREPFAVPTATVIVVRPALGGGGVAFPPANTLSFEAMLANPLGELPEIVRLAWLLAQIEFGYDAAGALIPPVLAAAEEVELARCDATTIALAMRAWHLTDDLDQSNIRAKEVEGWWCTVREGAGRLRGALAEFE